MSETLTSEIIGGLLAGLFLLFLYSLRAVNKRINGLGRRLDKNIAEIKKTLKMTEDKLHQLDRSLAILQTKVDLTSSSMEPNCPDLSQSDDSLSKKMQEHGIALTRLHAQIQRLQKEVGELSRHPRGP